MSEDPPSDAGWFADVDRDDVTAGADAIATGAGAEPRDWAGLAVASGFAADEPDYYEALHAASIHAAREEAHTAETAPDQQLKFSVRAMDDCERTANELAERVTEWAGTHRPAVGPGVAGARALVSAPAGDASATSPAEEDEMPDRIRSLARRVRALDDEAAALRADIERTAPSVAPNLASLAGPVLAARLIALAGGLEALAKLPSGTVQVLGAEDALFAHLQGGAPPPKHGVIYTHEAVRATRPEDRGSAARALAGKLTIAARIDHYSGDRKPGLQADLAERIERIRAREKP